MLTLALIAIVLFALAAAAQAAHKSRPRITLTTPGWMSPLVRRLSVCETHGDPWFRNGAYEGIVAWAHSTWLLDRYPGMPDHAYQASMRDQHRVALRSIAVGRYFGCLRGPEHAWVRG